VLDLKYMWFCPSHPATAVGVGKAGLTASALGSVPQYHNEPNYAEGGIPKSDINFTNASIRAAFIRKVFFMVSVMVSAPQELASASYFSLASSPS